LKKTHLLALFITLAAGCTTSNKKEISFYHWQSNLNPSPNEKELLRQIAPLVVYLHFFDVEWNATAGLALPTAKLKVKQAFADGQKVVPVVYLTNEVFLKTNSLQQAQLADSLWAKCQRIWRGPLAQVEPLSALQIDCDWTLKTRAAYFQFLHRLKAKGLNELSCTLRLHQVKFREKTGVPPVDKTVLMFYNMGNIGQKGEDNSILNLTTAESYLGRLNEYPLPFEVALPLFNWAVQFRGSQALRIIYGLNAEQAIAENKLEQLSPNRFRINESTYLNGYYFYKNDELRLEQVQNKDLQGAISLLDKYSTKEYSLVFYHLTETISEQWPASKLLELAQ
jgi:hypothetical protein